VSLIEEPDFMTPKEVAALFRVDPKTVTRWHNDGKIDAIRTVGGHRRYPRRQVLAFLAYGRSKINSRGGGDYAP
jgi:excisionase family DNA binding protein